MLAFIERRRSSVSGLTGIFWGADGVGLVRIVRDPGRLPCVTACEFRAWNSDETKRREVLTRLALDHDLKHTRCATSLDPTDYSLLLTDAPDVPADELRAAMRWRVKDLIDFHVDDATLDVFDVSAANKSGATRAMYVVAARNSAIQKRVDLCDAAGINLDVIDIPEMAQRNLAAVLPEDVRGMVTLSFTATDGLLTITRQGDIYLSRRIELGLDALNDAVDRASHFDQVVLEVQRSLDYFDSHFRQGHIDHLMLVPPAGAVPGLIDHLNQNLNIKAAAIDLTAALDRGATAVSMLRPEILGALGLALRQEARTL